MSTNQNTDGHHEDLSGPDAVAKIREIVGQAKNCFFCTATPPGVAGGARPMNVREVDDDGNLWFLSARESHHNAEIARDPSVSLYFQGSPHSDFLALTGPATITTDQARIEQLWDSAAEAWFTEGVTDPRITVIKVEPADGYYWDTKHSHFVAGIKMLFGSPMSDAVSGKVKV